MMSAGKTRDAILGGTGANNSRNTTTIQDRENSLDVLLAAKDLVEYYSIHAYIKSVEICVVMCIMKSLFINFCI